MTGSVLVTQKAGRGRSRGLGQGGVWGASQGREGNEDDLEKAEAGERRQEEEAGVGAGGRAGPRS